MTRTNLKVLNADFRSVITWDEPFGDFTVFVEESETDSGRYHTNFSQKAWVCHNGAEHKLFEKGTGGRSGHLLRKPNVPQNTSALSARDLVVAWLFENQPSAREAHEAALRAEAEARMQRQADERQELLVLGRVKGPFAVLAAKKVCSQGSATLAARLFLSTLAFNKLISDAGFQARVDGRWQAARPELVYGYSQGQVIWSALGLESIWGWALSNGITPTTKSQLLAELRAQYSYLPEVWIILDEVI